MLQQDHKVQLAFKDQQALKVQLEHKAQQDQVGLQQDHKVQLAHKVLQIGRAHV